MKKEKVSNKGFTLVELIIVVAVIAILAGVLAPQYLQYVERTRESNDIQVAAAIMDATAVAINDPQYGVPSGAIVRVTWYTAQTPNQVGESANVENHNYNTLGVVGLNDAPGTSSTQMDSHKGYSGAIKTNLRFAIWRTMGLIDPESTESRDAKPTEAQSEVANTTNFYFDINTETGEITNIPQVWLDLGIKE